MKAKVNFLRSSGATVGIAIDDELVYFDENESGQDVYRVTIKRKGRQFSFYFLQDPDKSQKGIEPTIGDVLHSLLSDDGGEDSKYAQRRRRGIERVFGDILSEM